MVVPLLPDPDETPEDAEMPEDEELLEDDEDEPADDADLLDEDLLDDDLPDEDEPAEDEPELAFFAVEEEVLPVLALVCAFVAAEAWVVCAPTTAAVAVAAVAASAAVQVSFLTRRWPAALAWMACRKWELVMATGKPARF